MGGTTINGRTQYSLISRFLASKYRCNDGYQPVRAGIQKPRKAGHVLMT